MKRTYLVICILVFFFCGFIIGKLIGQVFKQELEIKALKQNNIEQEEEKRVYIEQTETLEKILKEHKIKY